MRMKTVQADHEEIKEFVAEGNYFDLFSLLFFDNIEIFKILKSFRKKLIKFQNLPRILLNFQQQKIRDFNGKFHFFSIKYMAQSDI